MPDYNYDKDYPFAAFITNLGKYNEGELVGEWVKFPTTAEEMKEVFRRIGIGQKDEFGQPYEEWFITDYDCYVDGLYDKLGEYESLDELNYLASKLEEMRDYEYAQFRAGMEMGDHCGSLQEIINLTENLDCYEVYPNIEDYDDLGRYYIEELDVMQVPEHLRNYIDYEAYGRDVALEEGGTFTDQGYVRDTGDRFREYYDGERGSIPDEYRVMTFQDDLPEEEKAEWAMDLAYSKSYKNKKRISNDRENWVVFQDIHEAIIERAVYEQVQQKRGKIRKRRTNNGEHNMFSGLLVCADCGSNLHFHFNQGNPEIKYFNCSNYKGNRGTCTSTHYVRVDFLEEVVLGEIRRLTKFASLYEDEFVKAVIGHSQQAEQTDRKLKEKELKAFLARDEELDGLFERIYEDNVSGKLSDDRFAKMSRRYEDEQKELSEKIKKLRSEIEKQSSRSMTTDMFIGLVRKYTRARKLTPRMLNELIEKIEVFNAEKIDGVWEQRLRIHYNCVGTIEIPTVLPLPIPEVSVNTRKGVVVNYAPCELAV